MPDPTPAAAPDWILAATRRRLALHLQAAGPAWADREDAFRAMADALTDAIEQVRVVHAGWREQAAADAAETARLRADAARLRAEVGRAQADAARAQVESARLLAGGPGGGDGQTGGLPSAVVGQVRDRLGILAASAHAIRLRAGAADPRTAAYAARIESQVAAVGELLGEWAAGSPDGRP